MKLKNGTWRSSPSKPQRAPLWSLWVAGHFVAQTAERIEDADYAARVVRVRLGELREKLRARHAQLDEIQGQISAINLIITEIQNACESDQETEPKP